MENDWLFRNGVIVNQVGTTKRRKYPRMEASLMQFLGMMKINTFASCPEVRSHSNCKVY